MKKLFFLAGLLLIALAGCRSGREALEQQQAELKKQNEEIRAALRDLTGRIDALEKKSASALPSRRAFRTSSGAFDARLDRVRKVKPLPPSPTDAQIVAYLREIAAASDSRQGMSSADPQIGLCRKIGPGHLKLLLPFLRKRPGNMRDYAMRFYLSAALPDLVTAKDIPLIKANIVAVPELLSAVTSAEFAKPMKQEIFEVLRKAGLPGLFFSRASARVFAELVETPEDLKTLEDIYINDSRRSSLLLILLQIPKCDVGAVTVRAWRKASPEERRENLPGRTYNHNVLSSRALDAARYGHDVSACKFLLKTLIMGDPLQPNHPRSLNIMNMLTRLSDFPVRDRDRLAAWYAENQAKIVFDKKSGKFTLKK